MLDGKYSDLYFKIICLAKIKTLLKPFINAVCNDTDDPNDLENLEHINDFLIENHPGWNTILLYCAKVIQNKKSLNHLQLIQFIENRNIQCLKYLELKDPPKKISVLPFDLTQEKMYIQINHELKTLQHLKENARVNAIFMDPNYHFSIILVFLNEIFVQHWQYGERFTNLINWYQRKEKFLYRFLFSVIYKYN